MTVSEQKTETWRPIPGAGDYAASDRGRIRSFKRAAEGMDMKLREDGDGYLVVNITLDDGTRKHNASVARLVLLTFDPDGYAPGLQACHGPGGQKDNRYPENIRWDTREANWQEALETRLANNPPKPKPPKVCVRCGAEHDRKGRNCLACMEDIGKRFARLVAGGMPLDKAADEVDYPPVGAFNLALRHGGLVVSIKQPIEIVPLAPKAITQRDLLPFARRSLSVLFGRGASRRNSDGA